MNSIRISALALTAALAAAPALAQGYGAPGTMQNTQMQNMRMQNTQSTGMQGLHDMSATVVSVNKSTGMIDVNSEGMSLRLHFPPSALTNVKIGDRIKVQMGLMKT